MHDRSRCPAWQMPVQSLDTIASVLPDRLCTNFGIAVFGILAGTTTLLARLTVYAVLPETPAPTPGLLKCSKTFLLG